MSHARKKEKKTFNFIPFCDVEKIQNEEFSSDCSAGRIGGQV